MAILEKNDFMEKIKTVVGDNTDPDTLTFLEDVSDTVAEWTKDPWEEPEKLNEWEEKYNDLAARYKARFFDGPAEQEKHEKEKEEEKKQEKITYTDLFKKEEK